VDNIDAAKRMVEQRLGIALLPRTSVQPEIGGGRLFPVTVSDMPSCDARSWSCNGEILGSPPAWWTPSYRRSMSFSRA